MKKLPYVFSSRNFSLITIHLQSPGDFGAKFVEFWRYVTNGETLTRHKRITDLVPEDHLKTNPPSNNHVSERSVEYESKVRSYSYLF